MLYFVSQIIRLPRAQSNTTHMPTLLTMMNVVEKRETKMDSEYSQARWHFEQPCAMIHHCQFAPRYISSLHQSWWIGVVYEAPLMPSSCSRYFHHLQHLSPSFCLSYFHLPCTEFGYLWSNPYHDECHPANTMVPKPWVSRALRNK